MIELTKDQLATQIESHDQFAITHVIRDLTLIQDIIILNFLFHNSPLCHLEDVVKILKPSKS